MKENLHPYVVFLPSEEKNKVLSAIFGSKASVALLRFSLDQGISKNIYQKDLVKKLNYSNKTIIENLKALTKLGVLDEDMEKNEMMFYSPEQIGSQPEKHFVPCG